MHTAKYIAQQSEWIQDFEYATVQSVESMHTAKYIAQQSECISVLVAAD
jgi:hypothetical protein